MTERILLAVAGAHLTGQPLNFQLTDGGATLIGKSRTASSYELFALETIPPKPGMLRVARQNGSAIEVEIWELTPDHFGTFVAGLPQPMVIGKIELEDGSQVSGFLCEPIALENATSITEYGGWVAYLNSIK
ncbi:MAG: hypothetical protein RL716_735 [Actinomycetota bacterium]|jgi:allophanate hydrolase